jgi:predicted Fe-Mo cluster-binding NifX family protein
MKIAVAADSGQVSAHFGHCEGFALFTAENGVVTGRAFVPNPGHQPGYLPGFLRDQGAHVVIAGGMGSGAAELFARYGIQAVTGAAGAVEDVVRLYLDGRLASSGDVCHTHRHAGECGER